MVSHCNLIFAGKARVESHTGLLSGRLLAMSGMGGSGLNPFKTRLKMIKSDTPAYHFAGLITAVKIFMM